MASLNPPSDDSSKPGTNSTPEADQETSDQISGRVPAAAATPSSQGPMLCLFWFPVSCASGAAMGSMFGYGSGLLKKKGLKGSFSEARSSAKTFAIMSGVDQLVTCLLGMLRGKDDAYNAGIAGCCSGLAVSFPGSPKSLIQTCVAYGVLSFFIKRIDIRHALAAESSTVISKKKPNLHTTRHSDSALLLLHLQLPLPHHLKESFSSFCASFNLTKNKKRPPICTPTATGATKLSTSQ